VRRTHHLQQLSMPQAKLGIAASLSDQHFHLLEERCQLAVERVRSKLLRQVARVGFPFPGAGGRDPPLHHVQIVKLRLRRRLLL
jgi:hypothetical protein